MPGGDGAVPNLTIRDYAATRDVSRQAVEKAIRDGRLKESVVQREPCILVDRFHADREWAATTNPLKGGVARQRTAAPGDGADVAPPPRTRRRPAAAPDAGDDDDETDPDAGAPNLALEKALKARIDRQLAQLNLERATGAVVPMEAARRLWFTRWRTFRDRLLAIGNREGDTLAACTDAETCGAIVDAAIRAAFDDLPGEPPAMAPE